MIKNIRTPFGPIRTLDQDPKKYSDIFGHDSDLFRQIWAVRILIEIPRVIFLGHWILKNLWVRFVCCVVQVCLFIYIYRVFSPVPGHLHRINYILANNSLFVILTISLGRLRVSAPDIKIFNKKMQ